MPVLTDIDLTDPAPPVPGDTERAVVHARAGQIVRRRRVLQGTGALAAMAVLVVGVVALAGGGSSGGPAPVALIRVQSASLEQGSTITVKLRNDDGTFVGVADANRRVHFDPPAAPGAYRVFVTVESPEGDSGDPDVAIGSAIVTYEPFPMTLEQGTNVLDLDDLTPTITPSTTPEAPTTAVTR